MDHRSRHFVGTLISILLTISPVAGSGEEPEIYHELRTYQLMLNIPEAYPAERVNRGQMNWADWARGVDPDARRRQKEPKRPAAVETLNRHSSGAGDRRPPV